MGSKPLAIGTMRFNLVNVCSHNQALLICMTYICTCANWFDDSYCQRFDAYNLNLNLNLNLYLYCVNPT